MEGQTDRQKIKGKDKERVGYRYNKRNREEIT